MRMILVAMIAISISGCSQAQFGSDCSNNAIDIIESRDQVSASSVVEPFIYSAIHGTCVTLGRDDAYRILAAREKASAEIAPAASSVRAILDNLPRTGVAVDVESIRPDLDELKGKEFSEGVLVTNELNVLFLSALAAGDAAVESNLDAPPDTQLQRYEADVPGGTLRGMRVMVGAKRIYDYCGVWPPGT